jgi:SOS-response transcriptional repressor LexA
MVDLKRLAFDKSLTQSALGDILQIPQPEVSKLMNGRRDITQAHIDLLSEHFGADVMAHYIIDGGTMEAFRTSISRQVDATIIPANIIEEVKAEIEEAESVPIIPTKVANDVTVNVRKFVEKRGDEMERIKPKDLIGEADIAERIRKGSMMPTFMPGDIVFVQFLDDKKVISDGHTYYFDLKGRPTIIRKVKFEGDKLRLIAENPEFGDIITTFDEIENVADIVGMFRRFFSNQYADIEAVRRRKDEQIDKLIAQNGKALQIISSMIKK